MTFCVLPSPKLKFTESPCTVILGENVNVTFWPVLAVAGLGVMARFPPPPPPTSITMLPVPVLPQLLIAVTRTVYEPAVV